MGFPAILRSPVSARGLLLLDQDRRLRVGERDLAHRQSEFDAAKHHLQILNPSATASFGLRVLPYRRAAARAGHVHRNGVEVNRVLAHAENSGLVALLVPHRAIQFRLPNRLQER